MELFNKIFEVVQPVQFVYGTIAVIGGLARYFNSFANGKPFSFSILLASAFVAGFSGWMFATIGQSLQASQAITFVMAGTGGFFGEQTMKYILEQYLERVV